MIKFERDLRIGHAAEIELLAMIQTKYPQAYRTEIKTSDYDIFIPERNLSIEAKDDVKAERTGNIAVEVACNGQPSGLTTSKATLWAFKVAGKWKFVGTDDLRGILKYFDTVVAGDRATVYLIPIKAVPWWKL